MALDGDVQALEPDVRDDDDNIEGEYEHEAAVADVVLAELRDLSETRKLHHVDAADTSCGGGAYSDAVPPPPPPPAMPRRSTGGDAGQDFDWESMDAFIRRVPGGHDQVIDPSTSEPIGEIQVLGRARYQAVAKCNIPEHCNCNRMRAWRPTREEPAMLERVLARWIIGGRDFHGEGAAVRHGKLKRF